MCMGVLPVCMPVYHMMQCPERPEEGIRTPGTECSSWEYWGSNPSPLLEKPVLFTIQPQEGTLELDLGKVHRNNFIGGLLCIVSHLVFVFERETLLLRESLMCSRLAL